jgi:tight adherence protein B
MLLLLVLIFVALFTLLLFVLAATGAGGSNDDKKALARLNAVVGGDSSDLQDSVLDIRKTEVASTIPLLNRLLRETDLASTLRLRLQQAELDWTPATVLLMTLTCWVVPAYLLFLRTGNVFVSLLLALVPAAGPMFYVMVKRSQRFGLFEKNFPAVLDMMVTALRSGHSLVSALGLAAKESPPPVGAELRIVFEEQNYGLELRDAFENLLRRVPLQDVRIAVTAILIQKETGGNLAEILERCAHLIRERFRLRREIKVKTAQGRLTGLILTCLPIILGFALYLLNPQSMSVLWTKPVGQKLLWGASVMMLMGGLVIRKIVAIKV